ncbi:10417_t:CDS:2 [Acaulospora morrowiae]|uniref:10417_t:CDS:1 n=1 Tax=Acaulospora morrowiae TaxID=94023 RepID=A0A9N8YR26_9GLOM|nr:10417_t:CDS:2 [Acaulospora morrowiae]
MIWFLSGWDRSSLHSNESIESELIMIQIATRIHFPRERYLHHLISQKRHPGYIRNSSTSLSSNDMISAGDVEVTESWHISELDVLDSSLPVPQVNLENPHSILAWIQNYSPTGVTGAKPALLVESFGAQFTLCGRENTINTLWYGNRANSYGILSRFRNYCSANPKKDRNFHPIPFLGCGPGTGKSRFLQEICNIIHEKVQLSNDNKVKSILGEAIFLNITYGNGSAFSDFDVDIGAEASLALRILYTYFVHGDESMPYNLFARNIGKNAKQLGLSVILRAIYENKCRGNMRKLAIIVGIDEVNKLYDINREAFRCLVASIVITKSMHQALQLPLELLDTSHMLLIACDLGFDENFIYQNNLFKRIIADIGGQVRALEIFYELIWGEAKTNKLEDIDLVDIMHLLEERLHSRYDFKTFASQITPVLANAILERSVDENDVLGYKTIKLKELLKGALYSDVDMDVNVDIPDYNSVRVHYLSKRYPFDDTILDFNSQLCEISHNDNNKIYKNGEGAACDGFSFLIINCKQPMLLALQMKWRDLESENPQKINDKLISNEYNKVKNLARKIGLDNWLLIILSNCSGTFNKTLLPTRCAIVDKNNFIKFYGKIYSSRAQFTAAHDKVCVNSAKFFELRVIDKVGPIIAKGIIDERESSKRKFVDDPKSLFIRYRLGFVDTEFNRYRVGDSWLCHRTILCYCSYPKEKAGSG